MQRTDPQALARLAALSEREALSTAEEDEVVRLLMAVSPGEVQRLERRWVLVRMVGLVRVMIGVPFMLMLVYIAWVAYMFMGTIVFYWPATALGLDPMQVFLAINGLLLAGWLIRRCPRSRSDWRRLWDRLRAGVRAIPPVLRLSLIHI